MRHGVSIFATDTSIDVVELARAVEDRGLESLWVPEHTHIPVGGRSTWPGTTRGGGRDLPEEYRRCLDPLVALTAAATATERLRVGTGILLAAQHDPIATAKAVASLDHVSGGRVTLGIGNGWNVEEMGDHGVTYRARRAVVREHVLAMQALWHEDEASFDGEHVRFPPSWSWPKPRQHDAQGRRGVPVLHGGGAGPKLFAHIAEHADGWMPIGGGGLGETLPRLRDAVAAVGRDADRLEVVPFGGMPTPGKLDHYAGHGVTETITYLPSAGRDAVLPVLDRVAAVVAEHRG